jgi:hypothetical protein
MEKTYTIEITYEAQLTTAFTKEDIENALWVGDLEIGLIRLPNGNISICGDATTWEITEG